MPFICRRFISGNRALYNVCILAAMHWLLNMEHICKPIGCEVIMPRQLLVIS